MLIVLWVLLQEAVDKKVLEEPNQMAIASADANGVPSVRMVLLKGYDERGFMFYTNYNSRKAQELANGHAALCMYWEPLQRQVSIFNRGFDASVMSHGAYLCTLTVLLTKGCISARHPPGLPVISWCFRMLSLASVQQ